MLMFRINVLSLLVLTQVTLSAALATDRSVPRFIAYTDAWKNGQISWYYNPAGQPDWLNTPEAVTIIQKAMQQWHDACGVSFSYLGQTAAAAVLQDGISTLGWGNTMGYSYTNFWHGSDGMTINEGDIQFRVADYPDGIHDFSSNVVHEVGHMIGLSHSDRPPAVMFANGYNTFQYQSTLKGDDIAACARLYGGKGLLSHTDLKTLPTQDYRNYQIRIEVSIIEPTATPLNSIESINADFRDKIYFAIRYDNIPLGENLGLRFVAPDGSNYDVYNFTVSYASPSYIWYYNDLSIAPMRNLTGLWEAQVLRGDQVLARRSYTIAQAYPILNVPDNAVVLNKIGSVTSLEGRNLQHDSTVISQNWWVNGQNFGTNAARAVANLNQGDNVVTYFTTSSNSRYANTEATMPDSITRMLVSLDSNGLPAANRFLGDVYGDRASASLDAHIGLRSNGDQQIYVAAATPAGLWFKVPGGWQAMPGPLLTVSTPAAVTLSVLDRFDLRTVPSGTQFYAGFGTDLNELLSNARYGLLFKVP